MGRWAGVSAESGRPAASVDTWGARAPAWNEGRAIPAEAAPEWREMGHNPTTLYCICGGLYWPLDRLETAPRDNQEATDCAIVANA